MAARTVSFGFDLATMLGGPTPNAVLRACSVAQDHHEADAKRFSEVQRIVNIVFGVQG